MSDFGIKMSQPGWDVRSVPDADTYFSSSWPILKIQDARLLTTGGATAVINHNLGYPPLALAWTPVDGLSALQVSNTQVFIQMLNGSPFTGNPVRYFIFRLPINVAYTSPSVVTPLSPPSGVDHNFGFKYSKPGKSVGSKDFRDFTVHSSARSPLLHAVVYSQIAPSSPVFGTNNGLIWHSNLPYRPVYFAFYSTDNNTYAPVSTVSQTTPKVIYGPPYSIFDNSITMITGSATGYASIVILKDPLNPISNVRTVSL